MALFLDSPPGLNKLADGSVDLGVLVTFRHYRSPQSQLSVTARCSGAIGTRAGVLVVLMAVR